MLLAFESELSTERSLDHPPDPYDLIERYYDAENAGLTDDFPVYDRLVERFGRPVLDVGCGTGRVALYLARQGVRVVGIDLSAAMLKRARERAVLNKLDPSLVAWHQADARSLRLDERFRLAIVTYNTFMHFVNQEEQIAVLEHIAAHLSPGGGLAVDLPNPVEMFCADDTAALVLERTFADPQTGHLVMQQSVAHLDRAAQIVDVTWVYDRVAPDGQIARTVVPLRMRYTMASEMRLLLARAGFGAVELYGDYDFNPYDEDSPRLLAIAEQG